MSFQKGFNNIDHEPPDVKQKFCRAQIVLAYGHFSFGLGSLWSSVDSDSRHAALCEQGSLPFIAIHNDNLVQRIGATIMKVFLSHSTKDKQS
jgi:hypothetical protein